MDNPTDHPLLFLALACFVLWFAARIGSALFKGRHRLAEDVRQDFDIILTATLTLLGLIIGFGFSMAISRYDQRKNYEEEEANAIGTEYLRADLLPSADAAKVRALLRAYLDQRILFYKRKPVGFSHTFSGVLRWTEIDVAVISPAGFLGFGCFGHLTRVR